MIELENLRTELLVVPGEEWRYGKETYIDARK